MLVWCFVYLCIHVSFFAFNCVQYCYFSHLLSRWVCKVVHKTYTHNVKMNLLGMRLFDDDNSIVMSLI